RTDRAFVVRRELWRSELYLEPHFSLAPGLAGRRESGLFCDLGDGSLAMDPILCTGSLFEPDNGANRDRRGGKARDRPLVAGAVAGPAPFYASRHYGDPDPADGGHT